MVSVPASWPVVVGRNTTCTAQVLPAAIADPAQLSVSVKLAGGVICVMVSDALPEFVTVIVCAALAVATACAAKVRLVGLSVIAGAAGDAAVSSGICQMPRP